MYNKILTTILFLLLTTVALGQAQITGSVTDNKKQAIPGVSVALKDTYDGTTTDSSGHFRIRTTEKGTITVVASATGYETKIQTITLAGQPVQLDFALKEKISELNAVTVTAGAFGGGMGKKGLTVLSSLDVQTTAGANADISRAVNTLPGAQQISNQEGLFVRGGDSYEAKQFIDGSLVNRPYYLSASNIPSRGRYPATLFKGFAFSTGGYSALYGQALSSVLIMETIDLPQQSEANAFISPIQNSLGIQQLAKNGKSSFGFNYQYTNTSLYYALVKQTPDYFIRPRFHNADANFRIKTQNGMIKYYTTFSYNKLGVRNFNIDSVDMKTALTLSNYNWFNAISWKENLGDGWKMTLSASYSITHDSIRSQLQDAHNVPQYTFEKYWLDTVNFRLDRKESLVQGKAVIEKRFSNLNTIRFGSEYWYSQYDFVYNSVNKHLPDQLTAGFAETELYFTNSLVATVGVRAEYSSILQKAKVAPRASLAYRMGKGSTISAAYGQFYQKPENSYLQVSPSLDYTKATHYIINYQRQVRGTFLRVEAFYKQYEDLVKTVPSYNNSGSGYAKGVELYFRDKSTFKHLDYSLSYSYLDTKRDYLNYPTALMPGIAANHTATASVKRFITKIGTGASLTYTFATGRPYYAILPDGSGKTYYIKDQGKTNGYQTLDLSIYHLTRMGKAAAIWYASATNLLGRTNIAGYNYSYNAMVKQPILPPAQRTFFVGLILNWGIDRRQDAIDNL
ncbi:TonB-dependent receptor [Chitinophaga sancti]|uniref:TonB-dependent receptor n=1 Tax=Chitinophaga sancti TaxID=1004 RepID=A0A1K1RL93_9BACT|nr:TonB-dependent receptor [Chitinophaga sancti]WQD60779.1 TonB-dependent receptor [Chitinophaga sancti]WQG87093.1 TonB-dependent receptor [Chitinophaga sancti]SFW72470.1 TonB dependent receptor [Chitinophaga sancti]